MPTHLPTHQPTARPSTHWPTGSPDEYESICDEASLWRAAFALALSVVLLLLVLCIGCFSLDYEFDSRERKAARVIMIIVMLLVYGAILTLALVPLQHPVCIGSYVVNLIAGTDAANCALGAVVMSSFAVGVVIVGGFLVFMFYACTAIPKRRVSSVGSVEIAPSGADTGGFGKHRRSRW